MSHFIFFTEEGYTFQPGSEAIEPDIENLQVLGFAPGRNGKEAFRVLLRKSPWLRETSFEGAWCLRLAPCVRPVPWFGIPKQG